MEQKTIAKVPAKADFIDPISEDLDHEIFRSSTRGTDLKSLDQAIHNIKLGMELLDEADAAYENIEALLAKIRKLATPSLASNLVPSLRSTLDEEATLKTKELDQLCASIQFKGKKILNGSLSASRDSDQHLYLMAGVTGSPENRINLNTGLNIPKISSKTLGLGTTFFSNPEAGLKTMMVLENALGITTRLKQRSKAIKTLLQKNQKHLDISVANHQAAKSAPDSMAMADDFLRIINIHSHKS